MEGLFDAAFVEVDEVGDADDFVGPVGAAHRGEGVAEEIASGGGHAFLDEGAVPLRGARVGGEERF